LISSFTVLRDAFRIFDSEGKGNIQLEMVKEILTLLGHEVNDAELEEVMEEFDEDENGTIEFAEFIKLAGEADKLDGSSSFRSQTNHLIFQRSLLNLNRNTTKQ
jgi:hypothetical protein